MIGEASIIWDDYLSLALWAYRTTKSTVTKQIPFSLVYGAEFVLPVEIKVPSARTLLSSTQEGGSRLFDLETLEGKKEQVQKKVQNYQRKIAHSYNKLVKPRMLQDGDLVLKAADHAMKGLYAQKFTPNWEGPYEIIKVSLQDIAS